LHTRLHESSPIVVIGMHRSGTRVIVDVLDKLGVFMGADRQGDGESVSFMQINEWLFHQCGAFWSEPMSAHFMLSEPEVVEQLATSTRETVAAQIAKFAGPTNWHLETSAAALPAFGWKDPRNTFTLPVWKEVFPNLRVIHIIRHGVDVAASLARRHGQAMRAATGESAPSALTVIRDNALGILSSRRGWTLPEAFTMWEQYVEKARLECAALGARAVEIRYEDLLFGPDKIVPAIANFCGVPLQGQQAQQGLQRGRAFAFRGDADLVDFAGYARDALARYGYAA
jgi:sulfotransferase family protein